MAEGRISINKHHLRLISEPQSVVVLQCGAFFMTTGATNRFLKSTVEMVKATGV